MVSGRRACRVRGQARSTQRRGAHAPDDEPALVRRMIDLATRYGRYGHRRVGAPLRAEGFAVNHQRVERLWRREGLKVPRRRPKRRRRWLNGGSCVRPRPARPGHVWSDGVVTARTADGRAFRLLTVIDEPTRECRAIDVARRITADDVLDRLGESFIARGGPGTCGRTTGRGSPPRPSDDGSGGRG